MKKITYLFFAALVAFAMMSCSDDSAVNIDVPDGENGNDEEGTVYSITFNVEGGNTFTFSVDMEGAVIEGEDLPDDFDGDIYAFNPDTDAVYIAGAMVGWPEPGSDSSLELTTSGNDSGVTVDAGSTQFKFFIVPSGIESTWNYGEWEGDPNRSVDITAGGSELFVWGEQPDVEEPDGEFPESLFVPGGYQEASGYGSDWTPEDAPEIGSTGTAAYDGYVYFATTDPFKFTADQTWDTNWGGTDGTLESGGADIEDVEEEGYYRLQVNLDELTYAVTRTVWGIIGDATPEGWDASTEMDFDPETKLWTITADLVEGEMKFRANDSWDINYGSDEADGTLQLDGGNIPVDADGNYTITLDLNGVDFEYTVELND